MFKFDALSHRSSGSSLNVTTGGMGLVSKTSTPMSGSLEKIAEVVRDGVERPTDLLRRTFGTPVNARKEKELTPQSTPRREVFNSPVSHLNLRFSVLICHNCWLLRKMYHIISICIVQMSRMEPLFAFQFPN